MDDNSGLEIKSWKVADSEVFIDYGRYFVPERETQIEVICDLIPAVEGQFNVLELCCGEGLLAGAILGRYPQSTVYGYDGSAEMLEQARKNLAKYGERFVTRPFDLFDAEWRQLDFTPQAVVSSLALHHLDGPQKQTLYQEIYNLLAPGGAFIVADIIAPSNEAAVEVAAKGWDAAVLRRAMAIDGHQKAYKYFLQHGWNYYRYPDPIDKPSCLLDQLKWFEQAGFVEVDACWLQAGHAVFGGWKR